MTRKAKFTYAQVVYHLALEEKLRGIVVGVIDRGSHYEYIVDWGPSEGLTENHEVTLSDKFTQKFGD